MSCICSSSDRPGENAVRVARSSRIAPRLSGLSRMRSTLAAGTRSVAIGRGSADQSVRTAASSPTGSSLKRRSAKDNMRAEAASVHGRSSTMTRTARLLVRRRNSASTAVAVIRGSAARCWAMVRRTAWRSTCRCGTGSASIMAAGTFSSKSVNPANSRGISDSTGKADKTVIPSCVATAWPSHSVTGQLV